MELDVREPPVGAVFRLHPQDKRGSCRWCGGVVTETTPERGWLKYWHDACEDEYQIIIRPDSARRAVFARDKGVCCDCGEDWSQMSAFRPAYMVAARWVPEVIDPGRYSRAPKPGTFCQVSREYYDRQAGEMVVAPYVELLVISLWHVDHKVPLWKVVHLPALERLEYFKLPNLITRCHRCHGFKTSEEAAERAHLARLAEQPDAAPPKKRSRHMPGTKASGWKKPFNGPPIRR